MTRILSILGVTGLTIYGLCLFFADRWTQRADVPAAQQKLLLEAKPTDWPQWHGPKTI